MFDTWTVLSVVAIAICLIVALSPLANREARRERERKRAQQVALQNRKYDSRLHPKKARWHGGGVRSAGNDASNHHQTDFAADGGGEDGGGAD